MKKKSLLMIMGGICMLSVLLCGFFDVTHAAQGRQIIKQGSNDIGTDSYEINVGISKVVSDFSNKIKIATTTGKSTVASIRQLENGQVDAAYTNLWSMKECYQNIGGWSKTPQKIKPLGGIWIYSGEFFIVTKADRDDINCLRDLAGKRISVGPAGMSYREVYLEIFKKLGIVNSLKLKSVASSENPDVLLTGIADALIGYTTLGGQAMPPWMGELDARVKIKIVKPSHEEWSIIQNIPEIAPYYASDVSTKIFTQNVGVDRAPCVVNSYGWGFALGFDDNLVYEYLKVIFGRTGDLVKISPKFKQFQKNGKELNIMSNDALSKIGVPIHPGAAKFFKEIGIWKDTWIEGKK